MVGGDSDDSGNGSYNHQPNQPATSQPPTVNSYKESDAGTQQTWHVPDTSVLGEKGPDQRPTAAGTARRADGGGLEHDLSRVATRIQKDTQLESGATQSRTQRPLQIILDVAAVERDTDMITQQVAPTTEQPPGLLSHYLQLADVDQQRERLERRQRVAEFSPERHADSSRRTAASKNEGSIRQHIRSALLRSRKPRSRDDSLADARNSDTSIASGVARPEPVQMRQPILQQPQQSHSLSLSTFPLPSSDDISHSDKHRSAADAQTNPAVFRDEGASSNTATEEAPSQPPPLASSRATPRSPQKYSSPNLRVPFSSTDLTQFLPYALSTPGVQTARGSPDLSRTNSSDDLSDWMKRNGNALDAAAPTPTDGVSDAEAAMLNEKRTRILDGIRKLLLHQRFLCLLAQAMMQFGAPLHHLEDNLSRMARHLCITATFTTMPGLILISVEDTATFTSETKIIRCPNGYDMHRLELTDRIFRKVSKEKIGVEEATRELDDVLSAPPMFAWYWQLLNWGLTSWSVCLVAFNGSWLDSLAAFVLGIMAGCLNMLASRLKGFTNLFEVTVSILSGFFATVLQRWLCFGAVTLSATVVLLPGLLLTTGIIELTSRNMHAGTIRTAYALTIAFIIAFGINLGNNIFVEIFSKPERLPDMNMSVCKPVSQWWWWLAYPVAILSISFIINVHPRNWHACLLVAGVMFAVFWVLVVHLELKLIGPVVSAFVLGLASNIWSKVFGHNAYATMLPGMMILVPGSVGVRGVMAMLTSTADVSNTHLVAQMVQTALSIMAGLFASSFVIYPRGKKQSALLTV
ncbi:pheromone-regulated protein prm10 [Coemansia sp. IMI 209128]|nr:pheromone-regulated protein prm10 [Coemansia sp. IMI 209128]